LIAKHIGEYGVDITLRDLQIVKYERDQVVTSEPLLAAAKEKISLQISGGSGFTGVWRGKRGSNNNFPGCRAYWRG
jgi:hypothetical protein